MAVPQKHHAKARPLPNYFDILPPPAEALCATGDAERKRLRLNGRGALLDHNEEKRAANYVLHSPLWVEDGCRFRFFHVFSIWDSAICSSREVGGHGHHASRHSSPRIVAIDRARATTCHQCTRKRCPAQLSAARMAVGSGRALHTLTA